MTFCRALRVLRNVAIIGAIADYMRHVSSGTTIRLHDASVQVLPHLFVIGGWL
jgi:hypothetical protein